jgi:hypothetical protein
VQYQSNYNNNYGGGPGAAAPAQVDGGSGADGEYAPITDANGNVTKTADQVRQEDMQALFAGMSSTNVRVTRLRSDVAHAALADDLVLQASQDQSELEARRQVTREQGQPNCPIYDSQTCDVIGTAPRDQAQARSGGSGGGFWSCAVTPEHGVANGAAFASMLGFVAFGAARVTRRRRSRRRAS